MQPGSWFWCLLRVIDRGFAVAWLLSLPVVVLLTACSTSTQASSELPVASAPAPVPTGPPPTIVVASAAPIAISPTAARPTPTAVPASQPAQPSATPQQPATIAAVPFAPLRDDDIVDRPAQGVRALTDGTRRYRLALWSPNGPWIAAVPQDGPGMDIVNADTGALLTITQDTFVLEPIWAVGGPGTSVPCLLLHLVDGDGDQLDLVCIDGEATRSQTLLRSPVPLRAPAYAGGTLAYSAGESVVLAARDPLAYPPSLPGAGALAVALSPDPERPSLAWTPWTAVLTGVQTLIQRPGDERAYALTAPGEGWWMPRWAPSGDRLALMSVEGRIGTTAADGSARFDLGPGVDPAWSPDGERLAFAGNGAGTEYTSRDIFVVDWQATGPRLRLTRAGEEEIFVSPSWSPQGDRIAFVEIDTGQLFVAEAPNGTEN